MVGSYAFSNNRRGKRQIQHPENVAIGAAARQAGGAVSILRFCDGIGRLTPALRSAGRRYYPRADVARLGFIRRARNFGRAIGQVRGVLQAEACAEARGLVQARLAEMRARRAELRVLEAELSAMVARCAAACAGPAADCPILAGRAFVLLVR